jgi:hypothetical protein
MVGIDEHHSPAADTHVASLLIPTGNVVISPGGGGVAVP